MRPSPMLLMLSGCVSEGEPILVEPTDLSFPAPPDPVDDINPMIGTGGPGFRVGSASPAATTPFALVKLGPDTALDWGGVGALHCSGYYNDDDHIDGFSHVRLHGTGIADYGNILVMPLLASEFGDGIGLDPTVRGPDDWRAPFSKETEVAFAGYYEVAFNNGIGARLTASPRAGFHQYSFPEDGFVVFDLEHVLNGGGAGGEVTVDEAAGTVSGWMLSAGGFTGGYGGFHVYFYAELPGGIASSGTWSEGADVGAWVVPVEREVDLRVGISLVSLEGAKASLMAEDLGDFDAQVEAAEELWRAPLSQFELLEATEDERAQFYTSAYHLLQMPTNQTDIDGSYVGFDQQVHADPGYTYYSDLSLWDTYRTAHPAYILFYPDHARDFAHSMVTMSLEGTALPRWAAASGESGCMLGTPASVVLAETALKGITGWEEEVGYHAAVSLATGEIRGTANDPPDPATLEYYGYLPSDQFGTSVSWVQEVAWADHAISLWAQQRGDRETASRFGWRSRFWKNQWDEEAGFFHARLADGTFAEMPEELAWSDEYAEGNAWQYLWLAAQPAELAEVLGGEEAARAKLTTFFEEADAEGLVTGPAAYYWHGNEPDIHAPFLFALWGDRDATLKWSRWVEDERYANAPDGLAGNDDAGTLAAWYLFSTLGIYPLAGTDIYVIGVPRYRAARFAVNGEQGWFTVVRDGSGSHVASVTLNGVELSRSYLHHSEIHAGGELRVRLE